MLLLALFLPGVGLMVARGPFERLSRAVAGELFGEGRDADTGSDTAARDRARQVAPAIRLLGRTGGGKTSIVAALTGDSGAEVGKGFEPCTRTAAFRDFPREAPPVRFLDTRGLEEPGHDAAADIARCEGQPHINLVAARLDDPDQAGVVGNLRAARRHHRD